jgi:hypothetical protein
VLGRVRAQANVVVCSSNLRQLSTCMLMYEQDYKGGLIVEWTNGPLWPYLLKPYVGRLPKNVTAAATETKDKIFQCPQAWDKPTADAAPYNQTSESPYEPFYTDYNGSGDLSNGFKVLAAYGMNRYIYDGSLKYPAGTWNPGFFAYNASNPKTANANFWKLQKASKGQIPMLMDCRWREVYVDKNTEGYYNRPNPNSNNSNKGMSLIATRRHGRVTNVAFTDLSVKTAPLPELWSYKWRPDYVPPAKLPQVPW